MAPKLKQSRRRQRDQTPPPPSPPAHVSSPITMAGRAISNGRLVDFTFLAREGFSIGSLLELQGWAYICKTELSIYPNLVREFYANLNAEFGSASSFVKGTRIEFNYAILGGILKVPYDGILDEFPEGRARRIEMILGVSDGVGVDRIEASSLNVEMRVLHHIISRIFAPRTGGFNVVTERDLSIMWHIVTRTPVNLPDIMIRVMRESVNRTRAVLPYGMLLTHVFKHFGVKLRGEEFIKLGHTDTYNQHSFRRMGFSKTDGMWSRDKGKKEMRSHAQGEGPSASPLGIPDLDLDFDMADIGSDRPPQRTTLEITPEVAKLVAKEVVSEMSSRSSGSGAPISADQTMIPHISTVHQNMTEMALRLERLEHSVSVISGRLSVDLGPSEHRAATEQNSREISRNTDAINRLREDMLAVGGNLRQEVANLTILGSSFVEQQAQPPPQPFGSYGFSSDCPRAPAPHMRTPFTRSRRRSAGSSSYNPNVVSSSDED